jgi:isopenicillin N synthase-like dioxygenase
MPADDHLIGQTYGVEAIEENLKPTIFLINDRFVHAVPNSNSEVVTYQDIMEFITGGYYDTAINSFHVEPRISILRYIGCFLWGKFMEKSL